MDSSSTILRVASARLAGLEGGDLGFQLGILGAAEGAKAVELAELLFCHRQVVHLQIGLAQIFMGAAVLGVHGQRPAIGDQRSAEHTSEPQSLMRNSYAVLCLKKKK